MDQSLQTPQQLITAAKAKGIFPGNGNWLFIGNDTNSFLDWQFCRSWTEAQRRAARAAVRKKFTVSEDLGADFHYFVIPEKSVTCQEMMPPAFASLPLNPSRPALQVQCRYLLPEMRSATLLGQTYETGGTHLTGWGGYALYRAIATTLGFEPIHLDACHHIAYREAGDLAGKLNVTLPDRHWRFEIKSPAARRLENPPHLVNRLNRPLFITENLGPGPRAVIFRDSMSAMSIDFLAEHFSRAVFVWRRGAYYRDIVEQERPDLVLHIATERFASSLPSDSPIRRLLLPEGAVEDSASNEALLAPVPPTPKQLRRREIKLARRNARRD